MLTGKAELFGGEPGLRGVDYIFEANNSVLVAAAATGLKQSPGQMTGGMTIEASVLNCWLVYVSTWFILVYLGLLFYCVRYILLFIHVHPKRLQQIKKSRPRPIEFWVP